MLNGLPELEHSGVFLPYLHFALLEPAFLLQAFRVLLPFAVHHYIGVEVGVGLDDGYLLELEGAAGASCCMLLLAFLPRPRLSHFDCGLV